MGAKKYASVIAATIIIVLAIPLIYYFIHGKTIATHYYVIEGGEKTEGVPVGAGVVHKYPKIVVLFAEKDGCLYCDVVKKDLLKYPVILKVFDMDNPQDYQLFMSYLKQAGLEYQGVPTVLMGRMVFYSYFDGTICPNGYFPETIKIGEEKITVCALKTQPRYYLYMPSVIGKIIQACLKYKDPVCFGP